MNNQQPKLPRPSDQTVVSQPPKVTGGAGACGIGENMSKHTAEPWHSCGGDTKDCVCQGVMDDRGTTIAHFYGHDDMSIENVTVQCPKKDEGHANRLRAVACVNACTGINPGAVPDLVEALKLLVYNEKKADELAGSGMVDVPHLKALRASAEKARAAIAKAGAQ